MNALFFGNDIEKYLALMGRPNELTKIEGINSVSISLKQHVRFASRY